MSSNRARRPDENSVDIEEISIREALKHLKVKSAKFLAGSCVAIIAAAFSTGFGLARFIEGHETSLMKARFEQLQKANGTLDNEVAQLRADASRRDSQQGQQQICRLDIQSVKWEDEEVAVRFCLSVNNEDVCFPKYRLTFDHVSIDYRSSFWLLCAERYHYTISWQIFERSGIGELRPLGNMGDNLSSTMDHGELVSASRPYFPQIVFGVSSIK